MLVILKKDFFGYCKRNLASDKIDSIITYVAQELCSPPIDHSSTADRHVRLILYDIDMPLLKYVNFINHVNSVRIFMITQYNARKTSEMNT